MNFQIPERSLFALLLRSRWWISFVVAAVIVGLALALMPADFRVVGALSCLPFVVIGCMAAARQWREPGPAHIEQARQSLAAMSWPDCANALEAAFQREGYLVSRGPGDPVDFLLERQGRVTLVSARRWKSARPGIEALRALDQARDAQDAQHARLVCLNEPTEAARDFAVRHRIEVWQAPAYAKALRSRVA